MRYRMSVIYRHPVIAATGALRFADNGTINQSIHQSITQSINFIYARDQKKRRLWDKNAAGCNRRICSVSHFRENVFPATVSAPAVVICLKSYYENSRQKLSIWRLLRQKPRTLIP